MGMMDKILGIMKLNNDDEYDDYDDYDDEDDYEDDEPVERFSRSRTRKKKNEPEYEEDRAPKKNTSKITPIRQPKRGGSGAMKVCVIKPVSMEDSREITETLLDKRTVVLNREGLDVDIAQRIIDFSSGSCYAIDGNLQKISQYIFILTPASVDISGDFQEIFGGSVDAPGFGRSK